MMTLINREHLVKAVSNLRAYTSCLDAKFESLIAQTSVNITIAI